MESNSTPQFEQSVHIAGGCGFGVPLTNCNTSRGISGSRNARLIESLGPGSDAEVCIEGRCDDEG